MQHEKNKLEKFKIMKNKLLIFVVCFFLFSCGIEKNTTKSQTIETVEKSIIIDTTISIVQPIKSFNIENEIFENVKFENENISFISKIDTNTNKRKYIFNVKNDSIKNKVTLKGNEKTTIKKDSEIIVKKENRGSIKGFFITVFCYFIIIILVAFLIKKLFSHLFTNKDT